MAAILGAVTLILVGTGIGYALAQCGRLFIACKERFIGYYMPQKAQQIDEQRREEFILKTVATIRRGSQLFWRSALADYILANVPKPLPRRQVNLQSGVAVVSDVTRTFNVMCDINERAGLGLVLDRTR